MVVIVRAPRTYASRSVIEATRTVVGLLNTVVTTSYVGSDLDARHEQKRRRLNRHTLPEDRRRSTCVQTNGISASVLASGVFRGATLLIEKRSLCRQIRSGRVCKIRAVVLTCDVGSVPT